MKQFDELLAEDVQNSIQFDQHFLIDAILAKKCTDLLCGTKEDVIIEIGPGKGALTEHISDLNLILVERDPKLIFDLMQKFPNAQILNENILEVIDTIPATKIIGSLPYAIVESLFRKLIFIPFSRAVFIVPQNFAENIISSSTSLGFTLNHFLEIKEEGIVPSEAFFPAPKVTSVILVVTKKQLSRPDAFFVFYSQHHKKCKNAFRESLVFLKKMTKTQAREKIKDLSNILLEKNVKQLTKEELLFCLELLS